VLIPSGNTLVLGGLISDRTKNANNKVPLLGDIPFLGRYFFSKESKERDKANLIVFITPSIVGDNDYQLAENAKDFLKNKRVERAEAKESFFDSAKPYDWTRPKKSTSVETTTAGAAVPATTPAPTTTAVSAPATTTPEAPTSDVAATPAPVTPATDAPAAPAVTTPATPAPETTPAPAAPTAPAPEATPAPAAPSNDGGATPAK